jgi:hypothetical protein
VGDDCVNFVRRSCSGDQRAATGLAPMKHGIRSIENLLGDAEVLQPLPPVRLPLASDAGAEGVHKHLTQESACFLVGQLRGIDGCDHRADYRFKARVHQRGE